MNSQSNPLARQRRGCLALLVVSGSWLLLSTARAEVNVSGLDDTLAANVRALLPLSETGCDSAHWRVERLFRDADKTIAAALQALGYYDPSISKSLRWGEDCWHAHFEIQAGTPITIRDTNIQVLGPGANDPQVQQRILLRPPTDGDVLHHGAYDDYKTAMLRAAINAGYFDAEFERAAVTVDREAHSASVDLQLQSGDKYVFGTVSFTEGIIRRHLLLGYSRIRAGDPYSSQSINELYEALNGSGYFATVAINTEPLDSASRTVPVNVSLTPMKRRLYSIGGGFTTDTGPHGRVGYTDRRINDRGHQFDSKLFLSPVQSQLNTTYRWPKTDPRHDWISIIAGAQHENTETSTSDTFKLGLQRSRNRGNAWLETRYLNYEFDNYKVADQNTSSQLLILGTNWEKENGRTLSRVANGYRLNIDVRGASDTLGSDTSFLQAQLKAHWIHSLGDKSRVLARSTLAATLKDKLSELPPSVRYFAGGDRSIRGYDYESLGPTDADGEVIGGSNLVEASLEVDRLMRDKWAIAAFVDTGSAFNGTDLDFSSGTGIGLRWYSPVGPIRVDVAFPLDDPTRDYRLHISLGPDL